jgi:Co/Zn/Cd efflux system component
MPGCCDHACETAKSAPSPRFRRALWIALGVNAAMFVVEIAASLRSGSVSLLADAVDFGGDAANYGISLAVLSMGLAWRARAALVKGISMAAYGALVLGKSASVAWAGGSPEAATMGAVGLLALAANLGVAATLYAWRDGDANMRSVWLCSRNDAIGNVAVMLAAAAVYFTTSGLPDVLVAAVIAGLAVTSGVSVVRQARREIALAAGVA